MGVFNAPSLPPLLIGKIPEIVVHQKEENDLRTKRKKGQVISPPSNFSFYIYTSILQLLTTTTTLYGCLHRPTHTILFLFLPTLLPFFFSCSSPRSIKAFLIWRNRFLLDISIPSSCWRNEKPPLGHTHTHTQEKKKKWGGGRIISS